MREGAARRGPRRRGAGRRCERRRGRKPPRGRAAPLNSPAPPAPLWPREVRGAVGAGGGAAGDCGQRPVPARSGRECLMAGPGTGRGAVSLRRTTRGQSRCRGQRGAPRGRVGAPRRAAAAGSSAPRPAGPPTEPGRSQRGAGEGRRPHSPPSQFREAPGAAPAVGWSPWRGPEAAAASGAPPDPCWAGVTHRFVFCPCCSLPPRPWGSRGTARALALLLGEPRQRPVAPLPVTGGAGSPERGRWGASPDIASAG